MQDELESNFRSVPTMPKIVKWAVENQIWKLPSWDTQRLQNELDNY